ncbi:MAG TPA: redoxin domain-containing protein [Actinomycetota bacterium]|nr:redoxin domain-containing protein [Actinomycetota bacterium]
MALAGRASSTFRYLMDCFWTGAYERFVGQNDVEIVPPFSLKDVDGRRRSLDDFLDKPTLLVFTSPHCQPCKSVYPVLRAMRHGSEADAVNLVLLSRGATSTNRALVEENELEGVTVLGSRKPVEERLDVQATPWVVLVGPGARALYSGVAEPTVLTMLAEAATHRVMAAGFAR